MYYHWLSRPLDRLSLLMLWSTDSVSKELLRVLSDYVPFYFVRGLFYNPKSVTSLSFIRVVTSHNTTRLFLLWERGYGAYLWLRVGTVYSSLLRNAWKTRKVSFLFFFVSIFICLFYVGAYGVFKSMGHRYVLLLVQPRGKIKHEPRRVMHDDILPTGSRPVW